jgi:long-chain acyl-CoA synthetase
VDRKKDMVLVSGFNVYPTEIEQVVNLHPGVLECAAVGVPDARSGEAVKLYVVRKDMGLADGTIAEIHGCAVTQVDALTEPKLIDWNGKTYSILPQWQRAKAEDTEGGEAA